LKVLAILLAAGEGRRIGGCKALLRAGEGSFLTACCERLRVPGVAGLVVVTGAAAADVEREGARLPGLECVRNPDHAAGMLGSLLVGLARAQQRGAEAVLVHPVDHPLVEPATVARVVAALVEGAAIAVPSWEGRRGHPAGFAAVVWPALRGASPERGAREVLASLAGNVVHVGGDPGCRRSIDTPEDYRLAFASDPRFVAPPPGAPR
jgi:nicotine blue oxidoreductase